MQIQKTNYNQKHFSGAQVTIHDDIRDFAPHSLCQTVTRAAKRLRKEIKRDALIDLDLIIPINDLTVLVREKPKTFLDKLGLLLGFNQRKTVLPEEASVEDIVGVSVKALNELR